MALESLLKKPARMFNKFRNTIATTAAIALMSVPSLAQNEANGTIIFNTQSNFNY